MPRTWIYYIALALPLVFRVLILNTGFVEWLWYHDHQDAYYALSNLSVNETFLEFIGGWALPVFIITVYSYWTIDQDVDAISSQFLMLPIVYVPFTIVANILTHWTFDGSLFYIHPLIVIPAGYVYVFPWVAFVWVFSKLRLVM